jgi:signal peptidase I
VTRTAIAVATTAVAAAVLVAWLRRRFVVIEVDGRSMQPTLNEGDRVLVRRGPLRRIRTGDIVVAENPRHHRNGRLPGSPARRSRNLDRHTWMIKRAVAIPGDPVPASLAATVLVVAGTLVPDDRLLVLGDNTVASFDSRSYGYLSGDRVLGVVVRRYGHRTTASHTLDGADQQEDATRRELFELNRMRCPGPLPSRITVHRVLVRHGLVDERPRRRRREDYQRWERDRPMEL